MVDFVKTGIAGLDDILKGGFRRNMSILITGPPGTCKTIMALQYIYYGAKNYKEKGIFITTEERLSDLRFYAKTLGMDIEKYEKEGSIILIEKAVSTLRGGIMSMEGLLSLIKKNKIKRIALDSIIFFEYLYPHEVEKEKTEFRRQVLMFIQQLKNEDTTFLTVSERSITDLDKLEYDELDFVFDAFIMATRVRKGAYFERLISVIKVRGHEHSLDIYPMTVGEGGVKILTNETPFSLVEKEEISRKSK